MITKQTAIAIYQAYREIEVGEKLLTEAEQELKHSQNEDPFPRDPFGQKRGLQLGVPMGKDSQRMFNVPPNLAMSMIRVHISEQRKALAIANEQARMELDCQPQEIKGGDA